MRPICYPALMASLSVPTSPDLRALPGWDNLPERAVMSFTLLGRHPSARSPAVCAT